MKKFLAVLGTGVAIGFVLGSRAGRVPYGRLEATVREVSDRDDVKAAVEQASNTVADLTDRARRAGAENVDGVAAQAGAPFQEESHDRGR